MASHSIMPFPDQVVDTLELICEHTLVCVSIWMKLVSSLLWNSDQWGFVCPRDTASVPLNNESQHLPDSERTYHCMNSTKQMKTWKWNSTITALRPESWLSVFSAQVQDMHFPDVLPCLQKSSLKLLKDRGSCDQWVYMELMTSREWPDLCWFFHSA